MEKTISTIMVPTDYSECSGEAIQWASSLAYQYGAGIILVHVISQAAANDMVSIPGSPWEAVLAREEAAMKELFYTTTGAAAGENVLKRVIVAVGNTAEKIVQMVREQQVDLIVMPTHGRTGLSHVLLGSVTEEVVRTADCPVMSVRGTRAA